MADTGRSNDPVDAHLDITADRCPMTYVRVRLALDRLHSGQVLRVTLSGDEPSRNVPDNATRQGHCVFDTQRTEGVTQLSIRKR